MIDALVDVFASWSTLTRDEKRDLLKAFEIRIAVAKPAPARGKRVRMSVERVQLGVFRSDFSIYK